MSNENPKVIAGIETRRLLLLKARKLFAKGYEHVSTPDMAEAMGMSRGVIYHHFKSKKDLFEEVVIAIANELTQRLENKANNSKDIVDSIISGSIEFVSACQKRSIRRIYLTDAPAVLGWKRWREIDESYTLKSLIEGLQECANQGRIQRADVLITAYMISGSLNEIAFLDAERAVSLGVHGRQLEMKIEQLIRCLIRP
jgi:AcrR family transcriptional regulator